MSSKPITREDFITLIASIPPTHKPRVVAIVGGSASGKTTTAQELVEQSSGRILFSQDLFQLGKDFSERKTSIYKWDDPKNFDLAQCSAALGRLKNGQSITISAFEHVANRRTGTATVQPADIILWEGIYAQATDDLRKQADLSVFIDTPYVVRLLRRIKRFFAVRDLASIDDISTPARQMLTFVWAAERDFVLAQREAADYYIPFSDQQCQAEADDFAKVMVTYLPEELRRPSPQAEVQNVLWNGLRLILKNGSFEIFSGDICLYAAPIAPELQALVQATFNEVPISR